MVVLDLLLRAVSRVRHLLGRRSASRRIETGPGYPVW
jgi:hypothetical protein